MDIPPAFPPTVAALPAAADPPPALDVAFGLALVANNPLLYAKLLRRFSESLADVSKKLEAALAAGNRSQIGFLAHSLKGGSGTLGMYALNAAADCLERSVTDAGPEQLAQLLDTLKAEQEKVLEAIRRYLATA